MLKRKIIILCFTFILCMNCYTTFASDVVAEEPGTINEYSDTNLETLAIENTLLYPVFDNDVTEYEAEVSNSTTSLNILAIPENENASVEIVWDNDLKEGDNLITINVTAKDGVTKKVYQINVYKRNQEEEIIYEQEQEENQKKLEEIYSTENVSASVSSASAERLSQTTSVDRNSNRFIIVVVVSAIISFIIVVAIMRLIYRSKV